MHASSGIRTHDPSVWAGEDISCFWRPGHCDRPLKLTPTCGIVTGQFWLWRTLRKAKDAVRMVTGDLGSLRKLSKFQISSKSGICERSLVGLNSMGSEVWRPFISSWILGRLTLRSGNMETVLFSKMSTNLYQITRHYIPDYILSRVWVIPDGVLDWILDLLTTLTHNW
jgi:hypothetical protein